VTEPQEIAERVELVIDGVWHWRIRNANIGGEISSSHAVAAGGGCVLVDPVRLAPEALAELPRPRRDYAASAISKYGGALLVRDLDEAVAFANDYAPEHLLVSTANPDEQLAGLRNAGEILLGETPIVAANLSIGVPATLPTGGFARFSSGVTARTFTKTSSVARTSPEALERLAPSILAIADHEGFPAHARSIHLRRERRA
jgi:histidinol dehydrogenase